MCTEIFLHSHLSYQNGLEPYEVVRHFYKKRSWGSILSSLRLDSMAFGLQPSIQTPGSSSSLESPPENGDTAIPSTNRMLGPNPNPPPKKKKKHEPVGAALAVAAGAGFLGGWLLA